MKPIFPAVALLIGLIGALSGGQAMATTAQAQPSAKTSQAPAPAKKTVQTKKTAEPKKPAPAKKRAPQASKSKAAREVAKTQLPPVRLDLSLPQEMVRHMQPLGARPLARREPLLPEMFGEKPKPESNFQLNGRLLSNEMQLQLRNEERRDIEGAALDFEFKN